VFKFPHKGIYLKFKIGFKMDCYGRLKRLLFQHKEKFLPWIYPAEIFEIFLENFLPKMPFYTDAECNSFARFYYFGRGLELDFLVGRKGVSLISFWSLAAFRRKEKLFAVTYGVNERLYGRHLPKVETFYELTVINPPRFKKREKIYPSDLSLRYFPYVFPLEFITIVEVSPALDFRTVSSLLEDILSTEGGFSAFFPGLFLPLALGFENLYSSKGLLVELRPAKVFSGYFEDSEKVWNWTKRKGFYKDVYLLWEGKLWKV